MRKYANYKFSYKTVLYLKYSECNDFLTVITTKTITFITYSNRRHSRRDGQYKCSYEVHGRKTYDLVVSLQSGKYII